MLTLAKEPKKKVAPALARLSRTGYTYVSPFGYIDPVWITTACNIQTRSVQWRQGSKQIGGFASCSRTDRCSWLHIETLRRAYRFWASSAFWSTSWIVLYKSCSAVVPPEQIDSKWEDLRSFHWKITRVQSLAAFSDGSRIRRRGKQQDVVGVWWWCSSSPPSVVWQLNFDATYQTISNYY